MRKSLLTAFLTATILSGLILVSTSPFSTAQASADVYGIISSNTTWTKSSRPYNLTGLVTISNRVTLTIEAGVIVNLNGYKIQVNAILFARGSARALKPLSQAFKTSKCTLMGANLTWRLLRTRIRGCLASLTCTASISED